MANASPPSAAQAFLDALETSQIFNAEAITQFRERFASVEDPKAIARELYKEGKITKWQAGQLLNGYTGLVIGNYKLLDQLGVGEMGRVFLAEHIQMQRRVALKVLARKHTAQPQVLSRILAEARRVAALEHPNISHIQDVNQDGERYFLVQEYVDAEDLQKQVQQGGKLSPDQAWSVIRQAAEGIAHAHSKGIVHGGLKPSNLLFNRQGRVKILGFGLAQLAAGEEGGSDPADPSALTAKLYRAPEAAKGSGDRAGDVYSLGAILCFLLTGKAPADGSASADQITTAAPNTPASLVDLCRQLLAANPADRPATEEALLAAIDAAQPAAGAPTQAAPPPAKASAPPPKASKTAPPLPTAKPLPGSEPVAKAPPPKAKKPPVAKPLPSTSDSGAVPVSDSSAMPAVGDTTAAASSDTPFGGFAIQTKGRKALSKTASGAAVPDAAPPPPKGAAAAPAEDAPAPAKEKKGKVKAGLANNMPLLIGGGIGGGVLVLALIIGLVVFLTRGGKKEPVVAQNGDEPSVATPVDSSEEANPPEANPIVPEESNPEIPTESNPEVPMAPVPEPMPMPAGEEPKSAEPAQTEPAKTEPAATEPPMVASVTPEDKPADPKPEPKPEEKKPEPKPKPAPKPKPPANPFEGFAKAVSLPKMPVGMSEPPPDVLAPIVLGPCKLPDENAVILATLKGGETAYNKGKAKFTLESGNGGTSLRDWDIKLEAPSGDKLVVATMHAKEDQLLFQWTPEAAKQAAAPYLCNCAIEMTAGNGKVEFALREAVAIEPIVIGIDKVPRPSTVNLDLPPDPKQLMVEILSVEGEVPKIKYDNKELRAEKDVTYFWVGNVETEMPLCMRIETSVTGGRSVMIKTAPQYKLEGVNTRPEPYTKKSLQVLEQNVNQQLAAATGMLSQSAQIKDKAQRDKLNQQATLALEPLQKAKSQLDQLASLVKGLQTNGRIHFRIYASTDDGKVEIASTLAAPAP
jgi:serine/threonine protein kinase